MAMRFTLYATTRSISQLFKFGMASQHRQRMFLRSNASNTAAQSADRSFDDLNSSYFATASLTSQIGSRIVNEFRLNRSIQRLFRTPASNHFLPTLAFPSVNLGTDGAASPQGRVQRNWVLANTTSHHSGNHTLKWGGELNVVRAPQVTNENFNGAYRFPRDVAPFVPDRYTAGFNLQFARGESPDPTYTKMLRDMNMCALFA